MKDALAYLRILRSDTDVVGLRAGHQRAGPRDRGEDARGAPGGDRRRGLVRGRRSTAAARGELPVILPRARAALADFAALVGRLRARVGILPLPELLDETLEASGYRAMLADGTRGERGALAEPPRAPLP